MTVSQLGLRVALFALCGFGAQAQEDVVSSRVVALGRAADFRRGPLEFRLPSDNLRSYSTSHWVDYKRILLVGVSSACQDKDLVERLRTMQSHLGKRARVLMIDPNSDADRDSIAHDSERRGAAGGRPVILFDPVQIVARSLGLQENGDFAIFETADMVKTGGGKRVDLDSEKTLTLLGRSRPTGWNSLGKRPETESCRQFFPKVQSLALGALAEDQHDQPDRQNTKQFIGAFSKACLDCHVRSKSYDIFGTLDKVVGWSSMSLRTMRLLRMPGGHDPYWGVFDYEASLSDLRTIARWLEEPPPITDSDRTAFRVEYEQRKAAAAPAPSLEDAVTVRSAKPIHVPANGSVFYSNLRLGEPLKNDLVVQAVTLETNLDVVHHANLLAVLPGRKLDEFETRSAMNPKSDIKTHYRKAFGSDVVHTVSGLLNGKPAEFIQLDEPIVTTFSRRGGSLWFSPSSAYVLPKGTQLGTRLHMEPYGREDKVDVRFTLHPRTSKEKFRSIRRISLTPGKDFVLMPNDESYTTSVELPILNKTWLKRVWFHTHYRGVAVRISVVDSAGKRHVIYSVPFQQFKLEAPRTFPGEGLFVPAGAKLVFAAEYDNSNRNLANPNPEKKVRIGGSTYFSEMHFATVEMSSEVN